MWKKRLAALLILILGVAVAYFVYKSEPGLSGAQVSPEQVQSEGGETETAPVNKLAERYPFRLGLDLSGGSHLIYSADVSAIEPSEVGDSMNALRDVIERRINILGVSEPVIHVEEGANGDQRLVVDLPGVTDIEEAVATIGETPTLEFKTENPNPPEDDGVTDATIGPDGNIQLNVDPFADYYVSTELTGRYLERSSLEFDQMTRQATVVLQFNDEGAKLFEEITAANVGKTIAIYLDGALISAPVVQQAIPGGTATITGNFTPQEAKDLVARLNSGALPVPITLVSTQTIGPTLGGQAVEAGLKAALIGFLVIAAFLILWYRLPGLFGVLALSIYVSIMLALFKFIPVTLTAAGIAGFIISVGVAVDANILIFERLKEEMKNGRTVGDAVEAGFGRAWTSIRDSNISAIITSAILFWFGTSLIKGFALTLGLGVLVSLFSAIIVSRAFIRALPVGNSRAARFLFSSGISK